MRLDIKGSGVGEALGPICALVPNRSAEIMDLFMRCKKGLVIELKPLQKGRSRNQESYYRKWCAAFADHCGMTPDEMHEEMLCQCYGSEEVETKFGYRRRPLRRSNDASRGDYSELIETLCRLAAQLDFMVPPPEMTE